MKHASEERGGRMSRNVDELRLKGEQEDERLNALRHDKQLQLAEVHNTHTHTQQTAYVFDRREIWELSTCLLTLFATKARFTLPSVNTARVDG